MAKKLVEIEVNDEKLTKTAQSRQSAVKKSVAEAEVESFGVVEINNTSSKKKVQKQADAGYEKNVTTGSRRPVKTKISEVEDYTDFCFRKTAKAVEQVEAVEDFDIIDFIKEVLNVNVIQNNDVVKKIMKPSKEGTNEGIAEYIYKSNVEESEQNLSNEEIIDYIKAILDVGFSADDEVETKIMKPSKASDNTGLAEYYYETNIGPVEDMQLSDYEIIEFIKQILNYADEEVNEAPVQVADVKPVKKTRKCAAKKTTKAKKEDVVYEHAEVVKEAYNQELSQEVESILCIARLGSLFDLEKSML